METVTSNEQLEEVRSVIDRYIEGSYTANEQMLRGVFHSGALMTGYLGGNLLCAGPEPFIEDVCSHPSMKSQGVPYKASLVSLSVTDTIADAVIREENFGGSLAFEDHLHLINDNGWKIVAKTFAVL